MRCQYRYTFFLVLWVIACLVSGARLLAQNASPINIRSFKADAQYNNAVQLNWTIASNRQDSIQLIVERSSDGLSFQPLYILPSFTAQPETVYQYTDKLPLSDSGFYRLVCKALYTQPVYSDIQKTRASAKIKKEINIMPNPVFNNASVIINHEETGDISCALYDLSGKLIRSYQFKKTGQYVQHILDMYSVPKGDYVLTIRGNTINESKRILKQ